MSRFLVVEDEPNNMKLIRLVLKKHGHETIAATTGEEGLEKARTEQPEVILMDILLPGIDGIETTRQIRKIESMQNVPIIAITSYALEGDREDIMAAGCNGYFEKPINPLTIVEDIEKVMNK